MHFVEYLKRPNMIIGFVEFFNFSLSYKKSNHLWDKKNFNFNSRIKNIRKKKNSIKLNLIDKSENSSQKFLSWLSENNVYVSDQSTWGRPPHPGVISNNTIDEGESSGRGLIAFKNIQQNEKIIEIPENIIITEKNDFFNTPNYSLLNEYDKIAIFLIRERSKGDKSFWKPYLDALPFENDLKLVFRWKFSDLIFLQGSKIILATKYQKKKIDIQFRYLREKIFGPYPLIFPEEIFNLQSMEWAMTLLFSRAIYLQNSRKIAMVPYADLLNHNPYSTSYIDSKSIPFSSSYEISMYSDRSYNKFDQIFTTYGPKTNLELLVLYGFSLERNPFEAYEIRVSLSKNDSKYFQKKNFIEECGKTSEITFPIFFYQYPKELYEFMSFCLITNTEITDYEDYSFENENLNNFEINETVKKTLSFICKKNILKYPSIRNEDKIINSSIDNSYVSKNQKISLRQRKIEKKILAKIIDN
jgi:hypothetical protein